jgi:hypothetical protein
MLEAVQTSETSVNAHQSTRRYNPEDSHLHSHRCQNLKSYNADNVLGYEPALRTSAFPALWSSRNGHWIYALSRKNAAAGISSSYIIIRFKSLTKLRARSQQMTLTTSWIPQSLPPTCGCGTPVVRYNWPRSSSTKTRWRSAQRPNISHPLNATHSCRSPASVSLHYHGLMGYTNWYACHRQRVVIPELHPIPTQLQ